MLKTQTLDYYDQQTLLEAYVAYDDQITEKKPAILICHDWSGKNDFARKKAHQIAELGYVGFALDMYGKGKVGTTKEEKVALMQPLMQDRAKLQDRILAALIAAEALEFVDASRIGAIGFCFGGLCVLDLARSGANVKAVVSFHGLLNAPEGLPHHTIRSKILALHGYNDPMVAPENVLQFANEMTLAKVDWQVDIYGNTMHAFTNPEANDPDFGTVYNRESDNRSWVAMKEFFKETFA